MVLGQTKATVILDAGSSQFRPKYKPMFLGFQPSDVVCLDCGYMGTCLSEDERSELEKKLNEP